MRSTLTVKSKLQDYNVVFVDNLQSILDCVTNTTIVIIDSNVAKLYPKLAIDNCIKLVCDEEAKTLEGATNILSALQQKQANIRTKILAIGGGVLQDVVGFCASVYCRGIDYTLVPTTLLSQVDSCVGGKTSINFNGKKNILGTFYPPTDIIIYPGFVNTLTKMDKQSGLGEIYKFHILQNKIENFDACGEDISGMIYDGLQYKIDILSRDEFDRGERRFLNYGHTFGHALESTSNHKIPHGLAVVIGCMIATRIAKDLGFSVCSYEEIIAKGVELIQGSPLELKDDWFHLDSLLEITKADKKSTGKLTMVLVDVKPFLFDIENIGIVKNALKQTYESIRLRNTVS